jgi:hypothetical protein
MAITVTWDATFETTPAGTDNIAQGDDRIRELKTANRERLEREHIGSTTDTQADHGWHREGSAMAYVDTAEPTTRPDGTTALTAAIDEGRLWIDTDGGATPYYYTSGGAWAKCFSSITDDGTDVTFGNDVTVTNDLTITGVTTASGGIDAGNTGTTFKVKELDIGVWDMDATASVTVAHGVTESKIRAVSVLIRSDTNDYYPIDWNTSGTNAAGNWRLVSDTVVQLNRTTGGSFDSANFNDGSSRGTIYVTYEV